MSVNNGVISAPVSIAETKGVIGATSDTYNDLYRLVRNTNINTWARFKPTSGGNIVDRKIRSGNPTMQDRCVIYGLAYYDANGTYTVKTNVLGSILTASGFNLSNLFNLKQQNLTYSRLQDFNGYNHNANFDFDNNQYECFADSNRGGQVGFFYNIEKTMIQWYSEKNSGLNVVPLCYEDCTAIEKNYNELDVEDIVQASTYVGNGEYAFGDFKFGIAFKIGNNLYLFSTGKSINTILNGSSATYYITIDDSTTPPRLVLSTDAYVSPKVGMFNCGGRFFMFTLNLSKINTFWGVDIFTENVTCSARTVLVKSGSTNVEFIQNNGSLDMYAFSPSKMSSDNSVFGLRSNFVIKKLKSYVNITTKTDRVNGVGTNTRNAGRFLGPLDSDPNVESEYEYKNGTNGWNWYTVSSQGHPPWKYTSKCYLQFDSSKFYQIASDGTVSDWSSGVKYVRYQLKLGGFVCNEFRTRTTTNPIFINTDNGESVFKSMQLYLEIEKQKFINAAIFIRINSGKAVLMTRGTMNIGDVGFATYRWTSNDVSSGNVAYCTKQYGNETGNFSGCYSDYFPIDKLNYIIDANGNKITYSSPDIYTRYDNVSFYVLQDAFASPKDPKEFTMYINFKFSPVDIFSNGELRQETEEIEVYDESDGNTTISVSGSPSWPT